MCYSFLHCFFAQVWSQQEELFVELQGRDADLAWDGRCDSPGFSAKYLTYSIQVAQLNKIVPFGQVQVGEVSRTFLNTVDFTLNKFFFLQKNDKVKLSPAMNKYGFVKCLGAVKKKSERYLSHYGPHVQVAKYMWTDEPGIPHYYDGWHISNGQK